MHSYYDEAKRPYLSPFRPPALSSGSGAYTWDCVDVGPELTCRPMQLNPQIIRSSLCLSASPPAGCPAPPPALAPRPGPAPPPAARLLHRYLSAPTLHGCLRRPPPSCDATGGAPATCSTRGAASFRAPGWSAQMWGAVGDI